MHKTLIRSKITYAMETTVLNKKEEENPKKIEPKIMKTVLYLNVTTKGEKRQRTSYEIEEEPEGGSIVKYIKVLRLEQVGHKIWRSHTEIIRKITSWIPLGWRRKDPGIDRIK